MMLNNIERRSRLLVPLVLWLWVLLLRCALSMNAMSAFLFVHPFFSTLSLSLSLYMQIYSFFLFHFNKNQNEFLSFPAFCSFLLISILWPFIAVLWHCCKLFLAFQQNIFHPANQETPHANSCSSIFIQILFEEKKKQAFFRHNNHTIFSPIAMFVVLVASYHIRLCLCYSTLSCQLYTRA